MTQNVTCGTGVAGAAAWKQHGGLPPAWPERRSNDTGCIDDDPTKSNRIERPNNGRSKYLIKFMFRGPIKPMNE